MPGSVTHFVQLYLAPENPIDADGVGEDDGHANERDGQHDAESLVRRGGVVNGQAVGHFGIAEDEIRIHLQTEQSHQCDHRHARRKESAPVASVVNLARDVRDGEHVDERDAEQPRIGPHARGHMRHVKQRGHRRHRVADDEEDDGVVDPAAQFVVQRAFRFHQRVNRPVHHEQRHGGHAEQQRIRFEQAEERSGVFAIARQSARPRRCCPSPRR